MSATGMRALENRFFALVRHRDARAAADAAPATSGLDSLSSREYCLLVTYRRDGTPVPTPVWFALDGDRLVFMSDSDSAKVRRLRRDPRVRVAPCSSRGRPLGPPTEGSARVLPPDDAPAAERALARKYGLRRRISERLRPSRPGDAYVEVRAADIGQ
jgi:PPOX class probable F420-dependent enzyme